MRKLFGFQDHRPQRKDGFNDHALVPLALVADFEIVRVEVFGFEAFVGQNDHLLVPLLNHRMKARVMHPPKGHPAPATSKDTMRPQSSRPQSSVTTASLAPTIQR